MRTTLTSDERAKLETCRHAYCTCSDTQSEKVCRRLVARGLMKTKPAVSMYSGGAGNVSKPSFKTTKDGIRALEGESKPDTPKEKRAKKAGAMSRQACRKIVLERDGYRCRLTRSRCTIIATEVHELKPRARGGSDRDPENCVGSCHNCNQDAHNNGKDATEKGHILTGHVHILPTTDRPLGGIGVPL